MTTAVASAVDIRPATLADLSQVVEMGQRFLRSTSYADLILDNPERIAETAAALITRDDGLVLVADDGERLVGMIGLLVFTHHFSGERVAGEVCWWVEPDTRGRTGLRLLRAAEAWAIDQGVTRVQMVAPNADVGRIYERFGYAAVEVAYQRSVSR